MQTTDLVCVRADKHTLPRHAHTQNRGEMCVRVCVCVCVCATKKYIHMSGLEACAAQDVTPRVMLQLKYTDYRQINHNCPCVNYPAYIHPPSLSLSSSLSPSLLLSFALRPSLLLLGDGRGSKKRGGFVIKSLPSPSDLRG